MLILGCGNILFGDDGFGPAVAEYLRARYVIPEDVYVMDAGTGVRRLLFTLCLSPDLPECIILIDAVDKGRTPGEIFELPLDDLPPQKSDDFSLHQAPGSHLARTLKELGVEVLVLACQVETIPDQVRMGLSPPVHSAVFHAAEWIVHHEFFQHSTSNRRPHGTEPSTRTMG